MFASCLATHPVRGILRVLGRSRFGEFRRSPAHKGLTCRLHTFKASRPQSPARLRREISTAMDSTGRPPSRAQRRTDLDSKFSTPLGPRQYRHGELIPWMPPPPDAHITREDPAFLTSPYKIAHNRPQPQSRGSFPTASDAPPVPNFPPTRREYQSQYSGGMQVPVPVRPQHPQNYHQPAPVPRSQYMVSGMHLSSQLHS